MTVFKGLIFGICLTVVSQQAASAKDIHLHCDVLVDRVELPDGQSKGITKDIFEIVFEDEKNTVKSLSPNISFACARLGHMNVVSCDCTVTSANVACDSLAYSKTIVDSKEEAWFRVNRFSGRLTGVRSLGTEKSSTVLLLEGVCKVFSERKF